MEMTSVETSEDCSLRNQHQNIGVPLVTSNWTFKSEKRSKSAAVVPRSLWMGMWIRVAETDSA